jgi:hypothetical protein
LNRFLIWTGKLLKGEQPNEHNVGGSSMGAIMISLLEEFEILLGQDNKDTFSLPSVALPVGIALLACQAFSSDINSSALKVTSSFGSPLLYGLIPVGMAWMQQQKAVTSGTPPISSSRSPVGGCGIGGECWSTVISKASNATACSLYIL